MRGSTYPRQVADGRSPSQTSSALVTRRLGLGDRETNSALEISPDVSPDFSSTTAAGSPEETK